MFFKTSEEKKSAIVTTILFVIMILVMSIAIFPPEPPELEGGGGGGGTIALNFGFDVEGMGDNYTSADPVSAQSEAVSAKESQSETLTSDNEDAVAIKETPKKDDKKTVDKKTVDKKTETKNTTTTKTEERKVDKSVEDILKNLGGDGNSNKEGNQGSAQGGLNNEGYDGSGGTGGGEGGGDGKGKGKGKGDGEGDGEGSGKGGGKGSGVGNWKLDGRKRLSVPQIKYSCNESGTVVIDITVDRTGKVIKAERGRGGKNDVKCLVDVARRIALETKFDANPTAPNQQYGTITFNLTSQ